MKRILMFLFCLVIPRAIFCVQKVHFSVDDVNTVLKDVTENEKKYDSLFEHEFFRYLKQLNDKYGMKVTLYCFYELGEFTIADCTEKFKREFSASSNWLKFGYHSYNHENLFNSNDGGGYFMFVETVLKFTGNEHCISRTVRLDRFQGDKEAIASISCMEEYGVQQLLTADSSTRTSYYLSNSEIAELNKHEFYFDSVNDIEFYTTDFRFDDYRNFKEFWEENKNESEICVFTHEWILHVPFRKNIVEFIVAKYRQFMVRKNISKFCKKVCDMKVTFVTTL